MSSVDGRVKQLGALLESKNRTVRAEAAAGFARFSISDRTVKEVLVCHLESSSWDGRVAAADALAALLKGEVDGDENIQNVKSETAVSLADDFVSADLSSLDLFSLVRLYKPLLGSASTSISVAAPISANEQREHVDRHLDLNARTGLTSQDFLSDEDILGASSASPKCYDTGEEIAESKLSALDFETGETGALRDLVRRELASLVDSRWQTRHGAALALTKIVQHSVYLLSPALLDALCIRLLQVMALDAFNDFVTGRSAVAPVREGCAQCVGHILLAEERRTNEGGKGARTAVLLAHIKKLLSLSESWHGRQSALLVMKYYLAIANRGEMLDEFFSLVVSKLADPIEEVVSSAVTALCSLFSNERIASDEKSKLVGRVMADVWSLLENKNDPDQLFSGLDTMLIDLLGVVHMWLVANSQETLTAKHFSAVVAFTDPRFVSRTRSVVNVVSAVLDRENTIQLREKEIFSTLKAFYRALLFLPPGDDTRLLLDTIFLTALRFIERYHDDVVRCTQLHRTIGLWIGCLLFEHKNPVLESVLYEVGGPSQKEGDMEALCSDETNFLDDKVRDSVYVTRKLMAAKFLAPLLHLLQNSPTQAKIEGQPLSEALQLLFAPLLHSSSLYQNLGAAIVMNEWAAVFRSHANRGLCTDPPLTLVKLAEAYVWSPVKSFDELAGGVLQLTADCNAFVDWCVARGVERENLKLGDEAMSVADISRLAYEKCSVLMTTAKQREMLKTRFDSLMENLQLAQSIVTTNTTRIFALLSSALFYFGCVGEKLTPQVRPIVDAVMNEENETVAAEIFKGALPLLVVYTQQRQPRPYVKVLARAVDLFSSCEIRLPKSESWPSADAILSMGPWSEQRSFGFQSRNAQLLLLVCCRFSPDELPELYAHFDLENGCESDDVFLTRLCLHEALATFTSLSSRLGKVKTRLLRKLTSDKPVHRFVAARALVAFALRDLAGLFNDVYEDIKVMISNLDEDNARRGAVEFTLRLSLIGPSLLGVVSLLAPIVFPILADVRPEVRDAAAEAFRNLMPLLSIEKIPDSQLSALDSKLQSQWRSNGDFLHVLGDPSRLPTIQQSQVKGLVEGITLRHYQLEGITWMLFLRRFGLNGILADDMGLGKTLQTLALIAMPDPESFAPSLIVCPRTLVEHWLSEWSRFFPDQKRGVSAMAFHFSPKDQTPIVVASYEDLKNMGKLQQYSWRYAIFDEGHVLRNSKTRQWKAAVGLRSRRRLLLSGTPVQNSPADLCALFGLLQPGYLPEEKKFRQQFLRPLVASRSSKATEKQVAEGEEALAKLHRLVLPFVLRRLKSDVLKELPEKTVQDCECTLTPEQARLYAAIVDRVSPGEAREGRITPLGALSALRKLADHPLLVKDVLEKLGLSSDAGEGYEESGKMVALRELLNECGIGTREGEEKGEEEEETNTLVEQNNHRALIFCQWKSSTALVSKFLSSEAFGEQIPHLVLDGDVPPSQRQSLVDRFNRDRSIDVLVLTTHIGGVGLNLTGADVVIFVDHDWNPMKDLQACDRAHRLGQQRAVSVYRLITKGTIEQKVMALQLFKQNTADALIGTDNRSLQSMATEELMGLFAFDEHDKAEPNKVKATRKRKAREDVALGLGGEDPRWNLTELWDESQYEEQFSMSNFIQEANRQRV